MEPAPPFPIKARHLSVIFVVLILLLPVAVVADLVIDQQPLAEHWESLWGQSYLMAGMALTLVYLLFVREVNWRGALSSPPGASWWPAITITAFSFAFSFVSLTLVYQPLSYLVPDFVEHYLLSMSSFIYTDESGALLVGANVLSFLLIVVIAPVLEEAIFRGILLHRWSEKYGSIKAIVFSSLLFAVFHPDILGAFVFGVAMGYLYFKTGTLWVPILCHALNNLAAWFWMLGDYLVYGHYEYTLEMFKQEWIWAVYAIPVLAALWLIYRKWPLPDRRSQLPVLT